MPLTTAPARRRLTIRCGSARPYTVLNHLYPCSRKLRSSESSSYSQHKQSGRIRMFQQYPFLQQAHDVIRTSRPARYFEAADRLSVALLQPLHITNAVGILIGTDLSALDKLFEDAPDIPALDQLVADVQALTAPGAAARFHPGELTLENAVKVLVAFFSSEGFARLEDKPWANTWLRAWQGS